MSLSITEAIASLQGMTAYTLANMADTHCPDSLESEGAGLLTSVRDSVVEQLEYISTENMEDLTELVDTFRNAGNPEEIADAAPSIYTYRRFHQFTDLCAWQEDISDYSDGSTDMEAMAGVALYMIAERLVSALLEYVADFEPEEVDADSL